jgi:hypothetical protein
MQKGYLAFRAKLRRILSACFDLRQTVAAIPFYSYIEM